MRLFLIVIMLLLGRQAHAGPQGRWAGHTTVAGWPPIFTVVDFGASFGGNTTFSEQFWNRTEPFCCTRMELHGTGDVMDIGIVHQKACVLGFLSPP